MIVTKHDLIFNKIVVL